MCRRRWRDTKYGWVWVAIALVPYFVLWTIRRLVPPPSNATLEKWTESAKYNTSVGIGVAGDSDIYRHQHHITTSKSLAPRRLAKYNFQGTMYKSYDPIYPQTPLLTNVLLLASLLRAAVVTFSRSCGGTSFHSESLSSPLSLLPSLALLSMQLAG